MTSPAEHLAFQKVIESLREAESGIRQLAVYQPDKSHVWLIIANKLKETTEIMWKAAMAGVRQ